MFRPKLPIPVLNGFTTINRYNFAVGFTTPASTALLKPHTTRFSGSNGSGTDSGSTTLSGVEPNFDDARSTDPDRAAQPATRQLASPTISTIRLQNLTFSTRDSPSLPDL